MRGLFKVGFSLLVLAFLLIGVTFSLLRAQGISGPANPAGRLIKGESRSVGKHVEAVELSGPIHLNLRYGPTASLTVHGEQRLLGNVETSDEGGVLHIRTRGIVLRHNHPLQAELVLPTLRSLAVDGSGDSTVTGFSGERIDVQLYGSGSIRFNGRYRQVAAALHGSGELEMEAGISDKVQAEINGSGSMTLAGSAHELRAQVRGSGELDAQHLRADVATVEQLGSGSSTVFARTRVSASVSGSGDVDVHGNPSERSVSRTGSGEVSFSD